MAKGLSQSLRSLLSAMNLGRSQGHPLAGWILLSMLYRDGSTASEPMTMNYLVARYNGEYLDPGESRVASETLRGVMKALVEQAHLVTSSTRRVRERMDSGRFHTIQSSIYRINAAGIEYLKAIEDLPKDERADKMAELTATVRSDLLKVTGNGVVPIRIELMFTHKLNKRLIWNK
ncbi:hypothetical protein ACFQ5M_02310 [Agrilactobacillus yilanensis]|uniref:Uncharacterized protein n=1 Tax=Agrilactobacillus yilanensis TaxID=2485997 RepID=A0ABW4J5L2_9LACO|nr:hypothetical protein [Agrilactobacillus yilanensis]